MNWVSPMLLLPLLLGARGKQVCGIPELSERITGGQDTDIKRWPWQASLLYKNYHLCGGSLIHPEWVMTAAHCFQKRTRNIRHWKIQLGSTTLPKSIFSFGIFSFYSVKKIIQHPFFSGNPPKDIALVKLTPTVNFKKNIQPICIPTSSMFFENGTMCWVTGWGDTEEGTKLKRPWILQEVQVPLIDQKTCDYYFQRKYEMPHKFPIIYDDMFCAGFSEGKKDSCKGDSGGPLACEVNGVWHQVGIVSWGKGCGQPNLPGVYTNVSFHTRWIQKIIMSKSSTQNQTGVLLLLLLPTVALQH